jgi:hypothetical protein
MSQPLGDNTMNATTRKPATRKSKPDTPVTAYSPWVRKLNKLAEPLTGKLTKAINAK